MTAREPEIERLLPALVFIQTHLDADLSLEALARLAELSPHHFHRRFKEGVGETARRYVERLRVERAAFLLVVEERSVLDIALDVGFRNHETFTRAFRRRFHVSPSVYRAANRWSGGSRAAGERGGWEERAQGASLSATRVRRFKPLHLAFVRHVGPYEEVPTSIFDELLDWAARTDRDEDVLLVGVGHDAPGLTAPDKLRYDACLVVDEPFEPEGRVGHQTLPGGTYATTTHVGPYSTLPAVWPEVYRRAATLEGYRTPGLPVFEIYRAAEIRPEDLLNETELCLPVTEERR